MGTINDVAQNSYTTESAENVSVISYSIPSNSHGRIKVTILGKDTNSNNVVGIAKEVIVKRANGSVSQVGSEASILENKDTSLTAAAYDIVFSGSSVSVSVTGVLDLNVDWVVKMELFLSGTF